MQKKHVAMEIFNVSTLTILHPLRLLMGQWGSLSQEIYQNNCL